MNQAQIERSLKPSEALALDIIRNNSGINRYQADIHFGHGSLSQRVSELTALGFLFHTDFMPYIDLQGNERKGVAHYTYLGWTDPKPKESEAA
jgi:hypothetical protein